MVAVNDGVITKIGKSKKLGRYIVLRDAYGNRFTYAKLGAVSDVYPVPKQDSCPRRRLQARLPRRRRPEADRPRLGRQPGRRKEGQGGRHEAEDESGPVNTEDTRDRLYAFPERKSNVERADLTGQLDSLLKKLPGYESFKSYFSGVLRFDSKTMEMKALHEGSEVIAGHRARPDRQDRRRGAPTSTSRSAPPAAARRRSTRSRSSTAGSCSRRPRSTAPPARTRFDGSATTGQVLLMSKPQLIKRVLADPALEIYSCGREDIRAGLIDRRVLALLEYLVERGYRLTISSLKCGHSILTTSGNVSQHSSGNAVDIAEINGIPVLGNQGPGSITEALVKEVMALQGTMRPHQIISLMDFGADNTFAMSDHDDHVHVGYQPVYGSESGSVSHQFEQILKPDQWERLIDRIGEIDNPTVPTSPSRYALPAGKDRSPASARRARTSANSDRRPPPLRPLELPGTTGLDQGRYLGREPERVLVVGVEGRPPPRRRLRRRRPTEADPERRRPEVPVTTLTVVRPEPLGAEEAAARWLESLRADPDAARPRSTRRSCWSTARSTPIARRRSTAIAGREHRPGARGADRLRNRRRARRRPLHGGVRAPADRRGAGAPTCCARRNGSRRCSAAARRSACRAAAAASALRPRRSAAREAALQLRVGLEALLTPSATSTRPARTRTSLSSTSAARRCQAANAALDGTLSTGETEGSPRRSRSASASSSAGGCPAAARGGGVPLGRRRGARVRRGQ